MEDDAVREVKIIRNTDDCQRHLVRCINLINFIGRRCPFWGRFQHRIDIIDARPLQFRSTISHQFSKHPEHYDGALQPDEQFAINNTYFVLEADRQREPITRPTQSVSSYRRSCSTAPSRSPGASSNRTRRPT
jgi:hypothetical protein